MNDIWVLNNNHMCCSMGDVVPYLYVFVLVAAIRFWLFSAAVRRNAITWTHTDFLLNRPYISGIWIKIPAFFQAKKWQLCSGFNENKTYLRSSGPKT